MNKEVVQYLSNLYNIRNYAQVVLGAARGVIDKNSLHKISAMVSQLDRIFAEVILTGVLPGETVNDDKSINERVQEEKEKLSGKKPRVEDEEQLEVMKLIAEAENQVKVKKAKVKRK